MHFAYLKQWVVVLLFLVSGIVAQSATLRGVIQDQSGEILIGAAVYTADRQHSSVTGLDGSYVLKGLPVGTHQIEVSFLGFEVHKFSIEVKTEEEVLGQNIKMKSSSVVMETFEIVGKSANGSALSARLDEKNAVKALNVVSAKSIELSPDLTVANVVQRVSGISIERSGNGDGQYAIVRGMDKRYNYTLVNGIKIPSPDTRHRYVPLDIFPADLMDKLEVSKTLTPKMEGDAIGGVVNMVMKDAPDRLKVNTNLALGYSQLFIDRDFNEFDASVVQKDSPLEKNGKDYSATIDDFSKGNMVYKDIKPMPNVTFGASVGDRFLKSKLGVIGAVSYRRDYRGLNSVYFENETDRVTNRPLLNALQERKYSSLNQRLGGHLKLDYRLSNLHSIKLYNAYVLLEEQQSRYIFKRDLDRADPNKGTEVYSYDYRSRKRTQQIYNSTLQGEHVLTDWLDADWSLVYSKASAYTPDKSEFKTNGGTSNFQPIPITVERRNPREWDHNKDQDIAGYLNTDIKSKILEQKVVWSVGGMVRRKKRNNFYNKYLFDPFDPDKPVGQQGTLVKGVDWNDFSDVKWKVVNPKGQTQNEKNHDAHENIMAAYGQFKIDHQKMVIVGGLRMEQTDQGYTLLYPARNQEEKGNQEYTDFLPSISVKYMPKEKINIRGAYFKSISRPGFFEIVPYNEKDEDYEEVGNPDLKRVQADNFDFRFEYFPKSTDQILVGVFYKKIQDPIEKAIVENESQTALVRKPGNFGTAYNFGLELDVIKYFRKFGVKANYTFTLSEINSTKKIRTRENPDDPSSQLVELDIDQKRPLQGQSMHVANLSLLYKDTQTGWNAQLAFNYTGERIAEVSAFKDMDVWDKWVMLSDFSVEKKFKSRFSVYAKVKNIFDTPREQFLKQGISAKNSELPHQPKEGENYLIRKDFFGQTYQLGIRFNL